MSGAFHKKFNPPSEDDLKICYSPDPTLTGDSDNHVVNNDAIPLPCNADNHVINGEVLINPLNEVVSRSGINSNNLVCDRLDDGCKSSESSVATLITQQASIVRSYPPGSVQARAANDNLFNLIKKDSPSRKKPLYYSEKHKNFCLNKRKLELQQNINELSESKKRCVEQMQEIANSEKKIAPVHEEQLLKYKKILGSLNVKQKKLYEELSTLEPQKLQFK